MRPRGRMRMPLPSPKFLAYRPAMPRRLLLAALLAMPFAAAAEARDWQPVERIETYSVEGASGIDLYRSIGARGPEIGAGRAVAHTTFELLWTRDYRPQPDGSCVLAVARPSLVITYTLPAAPADLPPDLAERWQTFRTGLEAHERVHGRYIVEMVEKIEDYSIGLSAPHDPECQKVRAKLQQRLGELSAEQRQRGRAFDQEEMSQGGNVHQLILALVNGV